MIDNSSIRLSIYNGCIYASKELFPPLQESNVGDTSNTELEDKSH